MTTDERARTLAITHAVEHGGQRILDPEIVGYLSNINEEGEALLVELIELFEVDSSQRMFRLLAAADDGDLKEVACIAHSLKNASATIGVLPFASACKEIESEAMRGHDVSRMALDIEGMFAEVVSALAELKSVSTESPPGDQAAAR